MTMDLSRRSFLGGILTLAAVAAAPRVLAPIPRIVGDGQHDDTAGLQALFDGKPFLADPRLGVQWVDGEDDSLRLIGGFFRLTKTVTIRQRHGFIISGASFFAHGVEGEILTVDACERAVVQNCLFSSSLARTAYLRIR